MGFFGDIGAGMMDDMMGMGGDFGPGFGGMGFGPPPPPPPRLWGAGLGEWRADPGMGWLGQMGQGLVDDVGWLGQMGLGLGIDPGNAGLLMGGQMNFSEVGGVPNQRFNMNGAISGAGMGRGSSNPFTQSPSFGRRGGGGGGFSGGGGGMPPPPIIPPGGFGSEGANAGAGAAAAQLYSEFQSKMDAANAANEKRYQQVLGGMDQLYGRTMGGLDSMSNQQRDDIDRRFRESGAAGQQSLYDRGLGNTTITENFRLANQEAASAEQRRLADSIAMRRIGLDVDLSGQKFGVMERKTEEAPDLGMMAQLAMQAGAGGAMGGGGGSWSGGAGGQPGYVAMGLNPGLASHRAAIQRGAGGGFGGGFKMSAEDQKYGLWGGHW